MKFPDLRGTADAARASAAKGIGGGAARGGVVRLDGADAARGRVAAKGLGRGPGREGHKRKGRPCVEVTGDQLRPCRCRSERLKSVEMDNEKARKYCKAGNRKKNCLTGSRSMQIDQSGTARLARGTYIGSA